MENKFDDDFLEKEVENNSNKNKYIENGIINKNKKEYLIDLENIDRDLFKGVCDKQFNEYEKLKNEINFNNSISASKHKLYEDAKRFLLICLDQSGKVIIK